MKDLKLKAEIKKGEYKITLLRSVNDFIKTGKELNNCINAVFANNMADKKILVALIERRDESYAAVEFNLKSNKVTQCYCNKNSPVPEEVRTMASRAFKRAVKKAA